MGIQFTKAYVANGKTFASLKEAQEVIVATIIGVNEGDSIAKKIVENSDLIIDALTTTDRSRPKARAVNGGRKERKKASDAQPKVPYSEIARIEEVAGQLVTESKRIAGKLPEEPSCKQ